MATLFPMFLKLEGRLCLVVGGGGVAVQKIDSLLLSGAKVRIVAPQACDEIRTLAAEHRLIWIAKPFEPTDLDGVHLAIAATGDSRVNAEVFRNAELRGVLCNAVDEPERCHFYCPAVVRRGDLQIAISTSGHSPALAQRLRAELEAQFGSDYGDWLRWLGTVRNMFFQRNLDSQSRRKALHRIASREVYERFKRAQQRRRGEW